MYIYNYEKDQSRQSRTICFTGNYNNNYVIGCWFLVVMIWFFAYMSAATPTAGHILQQCACACPRVSPCVCTYVFMCCQIFQHTLSSKHPQYYSTMRLGRSLKDRCTKNDAERDILNHMLEQLKNKWNVVRSIVAQRYVQAPARTVASLCVTHLTSASWSRARRI